MPNALTIRCTLRSLLLSGTGTLSGTQNLLSWVTASGRSEYLTGRKRWKIIRYQNQSDLLPSSIKHTPINLGTSFSLQGGSKINPQTTFTVRPKLARRCWSDTMTGKSLRKIEQRQVGAAQGSLLLASPLQGLFPFRSIHQGTGDSWLHLRHAPVSLVLKSYWLWSRRDVPLWLPNCCVLMWNIVGQYWGTLPSQASELACEAADWLVSQNWYKKYDLLEIKERL
jgi:hypothetical protein